MVKGVSKQIIEVNNPDSIYFERAVFYLKPGVRMLPAELSTREINRLISDGTERRKARSLNCGRIFLCLLIAAAAIAMLVCLLK